MCCKLKKVVCNFLLIYFNVKRFSHSGKKKVHLQGSRKTVNIQLLRFLSLLRLLCGFTAHRVPVPPGNSPSNQEKEAWYLTSDLLGLGGGRGRRCCHTEGRVGRKTDLEGNNFTFQLQRSLSLQ